MYARLRKRIRLIVLLSGVNAGLLAQAPPQYKVDAAWPGHLPNNWILGHVEGIVVDKQDHIWVLHFTRSVPEDDAGRAQKPPLYECCIPAPAVLEFDSKGNVLRSWGGSGYVKDWPAAEHGFWLDGEENVWISGNWGPPINFRVKELEPLPYDRQLLKFSKDGKLLLAIGDTSRNPVNNQNTAELGGVSSIQVDDARNEVFAADGYMNRRIVVYDSNTGAFKRGWGAYGAPLSEIDNEKPKDKYDPKTPPSKQFRGPLVGLRLSSDGLLYVSDRGNDRIQVFTEDGKFVKEFFVSTNTLGLGAAWTLGLSHDAKQKYLYVGDSGNGKIWILNRADGKLLSQFGNKGHNAGEFDLIDAIAEDSHGNLYTGEVKYNNRLQKFVPVRK